MAEDVIVDANERIEVDKVLVAEDVIVDANERIEVDKVFSCRRCYRRCK